MKDVQAFIIGSGPAGLTAGMYTAYAGLSTVVIERRAWGGKMTLTDVIDNYPGFEEGITGPELSDRMHRQAMRFGAQIEFGEVTGVQKSGDGGFSITSTAGDFKAESVLLAMGSDARKIGCPGEDEFSAKGVSYCAICDGHFFKGKNVAVAGGGDSAAEEALYLTKFADHVHVIHRRDKLRAGPALTEDVMKNEKITVQWNSTIQSITGDTVVKSIVLEDSRDGSVRDLAVDGVFVAIGHISNAELVRDLVELDDDGFILTGQIMETNIPGMFAAGDIRSVSVRQVGSAVGDGTVAGVEMERYVSSRARTL